MLDRIKQTLQNFIPLWRIICRWKAGKFERTYRKHRDQYAILSPPNTAPSPLPTVQQRQMGAVHTFAVLPNVSWHNELLQELAHVGPISHFDYQELTGSSTYNKAFLELRRRVNANLLAEFDRVHQANPVDWLFAYAQGDHILADTIRTIRERYNVPTVNMCLDDKNSWDLGTVGEQINGSKGLVPAFDLWWTQARSVLDWIKSEGGRGIYLPEGCNPARYFPTHVPYDIPVSFMGACYGTRPIMIDYLKRHDIPVQLFGRGWGKAGRYTSQEELVDIFRRSQINLGTGAASYSEQITNVKGRDFEVPCTGGGVYLTTFNADLAQHFLIGTEILCWHSYDEMLELIRYYLDRPDDCRAMAIRARDRSLREHRWLHRYQEILRVLGILDETTSINAASNRIDTTHHL